MISTDLILNALAVALLAGMMFLPLINIVVGTVLGGGLSGYVGALVGVLIALVITGVEVVLLRGESDWRRTLPAKIASRSGLHSRPQS